MKPKWTVHGIKEFQGKIKELTEFIRIHGWNAMDEVMGTAATYAQTTGNYEDQTSNLRSGIVGKAIKTDAKGTYVIGRLSTDRDYSAAVEARGYKVITHVFSKSYLKKYDKIFVKRFLEFRDMK